MADKKVPTPDKADELSRLIGLLKQAESMPNDGEPMEADSRDQGTKSGSNVKDVKQVAVRPGESNAQAMPVLEIGDDPAKAAEGPKVKKSEADGIEQIVDSGKPFVVKQAAAEMADRLDDLSGKLMHFAAAEVVAELAVLHQAAMESSAVEEAIPELSELLGIPKMASAALAGGILCGDVSQEDLSDMVEQTRLLSHVAQSTGMPADQVYKVAESIGDEAFRHGVTPEQVVHTAVAHIQKQALAETREAYNQTAQLIKQATADNDMFTVSMARRRMSGLEKQTESILGMGHFAEAPEDSEEPEETEEPKEEVPETEEEVPAAPEAPADPATAAVPDEGPGDELAAGLMAQNIAPEQVQIVTEAIQTLADSGIPPEVIAQAVAERMGGGVPDLGKMASSEELTAEALDANPLLMCHVALDMAVRKAVEAVKER